MLSSDPQTCIWGAGRSPDVHVLYLQVFEELLLDADWSLNAGNWQWLSASAFFHQFFRVYSPVAFGKKTDKNGDYIKWVERDQTTSL